MSQKKKFDDDTIGKIARAYRAGASPSDIGRQFGCSCQYVINISRAYETKLKLKAFEALSKRHDRLMRQQVQAPAMETPDPGLAYVPIIYHGKQIIRIVKKVSRGKAGEGFDSMISLPYLAIQGNR